jgi:hypothetical protein
MLPKRRVPNVANQDGGQQVPSAMTVDAQLVRLHRRRTLGVIVRPRYRQACASSGCPIRVHDLARFRKPPG